LGDKARADDASQETFFRLSQKSESVKQSLGGWLHTTATRLAIDAVRSEASRAQREAKYEPRPASESMQWAEISPHVDEALAELPEETRALLVRHFLQNVSQCMLAGELRTSPATVSRKIKAGVDLLRAQLKKKGVCIAAAMLVTLMREHAASAAPATLMRELGKITMLSGGKPAGVLTPASVTGSVWWISAVGLLAVVFGGLFYSVSYHPPGVSKPAASVVEEPRVDADQIREARLAKLREAGLNG
jgi:RNA polymerase sigma factor (sigma-70 family)